VIVALTAVYRNQLKPVNSTGETTKQRKGLTSNNQQWFGCWISSPKSNCKKYQIESNPNRRLPNLIFKLSDHDLNPNRDWDLPITVWDLPITVWQYHKNSHVWYPAHRFTMTTYSGEATHVYGFEPPRVCRTTCASQSAGSEIICI